MLQSLIKALLSGLHSIWVEWCSIIYSISFEEYAIEELRSVREEFNALLLDNSFQRFLSSSQIPLPHNITSTPCSILKGWLFEFYTSILDFLCYSQLNLASSAFIDKIDVSCSPNDINLRTMIRLN